MPTDKNNSTVDEKNRKLLDKLINATELYYLLQLRQTRIRDGIHIFIPELEYAPDSKYHRTWGFSGGFLHIAPHAIKSSGWSISNFLKRVFAHANGTTFFPFSATGKKIPLSDGNAHGVKLKLSQPVNIKKLPVDYRPTAIVFMIKDSNGILRVLTVDSAHRYVRPKGLDDHARRMPSEHVSQIELPSGRSYEEAKERACDELLELFFADNLFKENTDSGRQLNDYPYVTLVSLILNREGALSNFLVNITDEELDRIFEEALNKKGIVACKKYLYEEIVKANDGQPKMDVDDTEIDRAGKSFVNNTIDDIFTTHGHPLAELRNDLKYLLLLPDFRELFDNSDFDMERCLALSENKDVKSTVYLQQVFAHIMRSYASEPRLGMFLINRLKRYLYKIYCLDDYNNFVRSVESAEQLKRNDPYLQESDPDATDESMRTTEHIDCLLDINNIASRNSLAVNTKRTRSLSSRLTLVTQLLKDERGVTQTAKILTLRSLRNNFTPNEQTIKQLQQVRDGLKNYALPLIKRLIIDQPEDRTKQSKNEMEHTIKFLEDNPIFTEYNLLVSILNNVITAVFNADGRHRTDDLVMVNVPAYQRNGEILTVKWLKPALAKQWECIFKLFYDDISYNDPHNREPIDIALLNKLHGANYKQYLPYIGDMVVMLRQIAAECRRHMSEKDKVKNPMPMGVVTDESLAEYTLALTKKTMAPKVKANVKPAGGMGLLGIFSRASLRRKQHPETPSAPHQKRPSRRQELTKGRIAKQKKRPVTLAFDRDTRLLTGLNIPCEEPPSGQRYSYPSSEGLGIVH